MAVIEPVNDIVALEVPVPTVKLRPEAPPRLSAPLVEASVTCIGLTPASGSEIEIAFPFAVEKTS